MTNTHKRPKFRKIIRVLGIIAAAPIIIAILHIATFKYQLAHGLEDDLREAALRECMGQGRVLRARGPLNGRYVHFFSVEGKEPSTDFMHRFPNEKLVLRKISQAIKAPVQDTMNRTTIWQDKATGRRGLISNVHLEWLSPFNAKVTVQTGYESVELKYLGIGRWWKTYWHSMTFATH